jgi:hypothetical protein
VSNESGPERFRDYFKYISTVDAAGIVGVLALQEEFDLGLATIGLALLFFGLSAYLCIIGLFWLTRTPQWAEGELIDWLVLIVFAFTTSGVALPIVVSLSLE